MNIGMGLGVGYSPRKGGGESLAAIFALARRQRVDFVGIGDSNQLLSGHGWDHGFQYALDAAGISMYATGLISAQENNADGGGTGYGYNFNASQPVIGAISGAPTYQHDRLDPGLASLSPHNYIYLASGTYASGGNSGWNIASDCVLDVTAQIQFDWHYSTFASGSGGQWRGAVRLETSPFTVLAQTATLSTTTGADSMQIASLTLSADAGRSGKPLGAKWTRPGLTDITGPFFGLWQRASRPDRLTGYSYHTLYGSGGQSAYDMAYAMQQASDNTLSYFFGETRRLQGDDKCVVVIINTGLNDRNETSQPSLGPDAETDADSPEAFADNCRAIVERIQEIWTLNAWDASELHFAFMVSHPISDPDDAELVSYRAAIAAYAATIDQGHVIDLAAKTTSAAILANGWYASSGTDKAHLTLAGYQGMAELAIAR